MKKFQSVASCFGLDDYRDVPQFVSDFMDECQIDRRLPATFANFDKAQLVEQMRADHTQSMRVATSREVTDEAIIEIVDKIAALAVMD